MHRLMFSLAALFVTAPLFAAPAQHGFPPVKNVELQPLAAQVKRVVQALDYLGAPLPDADKKAIDAAATDKAKGVETIQSILDKHCLANVCVLAGDSGQVVVEAISGPAKPEL